MSEATFENLTEAEQKRASRQAARIERINFRLERARNAGNTAEVAALEKELERRQLELRLYELKNAE